MVIPAHTCCCIGLLLQAAKNKSNKINHQSNMEAIIAALVQLDIDESNAKKYANALWKEGVTTPALLRNVVQEDLTAAGITTRVHVRAILTGAHGHGPATVASRRTGGFSTITRQEEKKFDVFLAHNCSGGNHDKVAVINDFLKRQGISTWFDADMLPGQDEITHAMSKGIDGSRKMLVFITQEYINKVGGDVPDNCKQEFMYASKRLGVHNMIAVVMEKAMCDQSKWSGRVGITMGDTYFFNLNPTVVGPERDKILKQLMSVIKGDVSASSLQAMAASSPKSPTGSSKAAATVRKPDLKLIDNGNVTEIIRVLKTDAIVDQNLAVKCCKKIGEIPFESKKKWSRLFTRSSSSTEQKLMTFVNAGAAVAVVECMKVWGKTDADVAQWACAAVSVLCYDDASATKLASVGACEATMECLLAWGKRNAKVAEEGCWAVRNLATDNPYNTATLVGAGAYVAVVDCLRIWGSLNADVADGGCGAIVAIAEADDTGKVATLVSDVACKSAVDCLSTWGIEESDVAEIGCAAIANLADANEANITSLGAAGACEAVIQCLRAWSKTSAEVAAEGCDAVANLSSKPYAFFGEDPNRHKLGAGGACELVVDCLRKWGESDVDVATSGSRAVNHLATNESNKAKLIKFGAIEAIQNSLASKDRDEAAAKLR